MKPIRASIANAMNHLGEAEKRRLDAVFEALLPMESVGWESFAAVDRAPFHRAVEHATAPSFGPGLRAMLELVTYLPLANARYRKPFHALSKPDRIAFLEGLAKDERYVVRQAVTSLKMLACLAYFDDPRVRARVPGGVG